MVKQVPQCCGIEMKFSYRVRVRGIVYEHFVCGLCNRKDEVCLDEN